MATDLQNSKPEMEARYDRRGTRLSARELPVDKVLLALVVGLTLFGAVMVYSASAVLAQKNYGNQFYFL